MFSSLNFFDDFDWFGAFKWIPFEVLLKPLLVVWGGWIGKSVMSWSLSCMQDFLAELPESCRLLAPPLQLSVRCFLALRFKLSERGFDFKLNNWVILDLCFQLGWSEHEDSSSFGLAKEFFWLPGSLTGVDVAASLSMPDDPSPWLLIPSCWEPSAEVSFKPLSGEFLISFCLFFS